MFSFIIKKYREKEAQLQCGLIDKMFSFIIKIIDKKKPNFTVVYQECSYSRCGVKFPEAPSLILNTKESLTASVQIINIGSMYKCIGGEYII